ncbi:MAG: IPT/TIG domain-containing protein [Prevotella sp.]|nr:IPT/TIG domain-containing protein [Prevotella sp.]
MITRLVKLFFAGFVGCVIGATTACSDDEGLGSPTITVSQFSPASALPGSVLTIDGQNFGDNGRVFFNETEATDYVSRSATQIKVRVPANAASGRIGVINGSEYGFSSASFTFIPSASIEEYSVKRAPVGETITIKGKNFHNVDPSKVTVTFGGGKVAQIVSYSSTEISVVIPEGAETGAITIQFGDIQTITGPEFTIGEIYVDVPDFQFLLSDYEAGGGNFQIGSGYEAYIESTKRGAYLIYKFSVDYEGLYDVNCQMTTNQGYACYVNMDMGVDADELAGRASNTTLSQQVEKLGWATMKDYSYGPFLLKKGQTYYLRILFEAEGTSWVANVTNVILHYSDDQSQAGINVDGGGPGYNIYQSDFNGGASLLPFSPSWAWEPNYIKVVDNYCEFYYNQAALDADNRRERRGCELTCGFSSNSEGWYGFRFRLPDEQKFPKNIGGIIAQLFNQGDQNSWAGHLSLNTKEQLVLSYRHALVDPTEKVVGTVEWGKWINVVLYFRVGRNGKGQIKVWMGDNLQEAQPTVNQDGINFGFGEWIDDTHLNNVARSDYKAAQIGCKFGLYVSSGGDRTIHFDDVKFLEGNPDGAFDIVKP